MHSFSTIDSEERLRAILGEPTDLVKAKLADRLNALTAQFVEAIAVRLRRDRAA